MLQYLLQPFSNKSVTARENSPIPMLLFRKVVRAVVSHSPLQFSMQHFAKNCRHISMRDNFFSIPISLLPAPYPTLFQSVP